MPNSSAPCQFVHLSAAQHLLAGDRRPLFLNGINLAWVQWGKDFEPLVPKSARSVGLHTATYCRMEEAIRFVVSSGGNAIRVWVFSEPAKSLRWQGSDVVVGLADGVLLGVTTLLDLARHYGVHVVLVLFNGALARDDKACALFGNERVSAWLRLNAIRELASAVRDHPSLAMWELANEPEGVLERSAAPAKNTAAARAGGAGLDDGCEASGIARCTTAADYHGWNERCRVPARVLQRWANRLAAELRRSDPNHLITLGSWGHCAVDRGVGAAGRGAADIFSSECLVRAGGEESGTLDVRQVHSYTRRRLPNPKKP